MEHGPVARVATAGNAVGRAMTVMAGTDGTAIAAALVVAAGCSMAASSSS